MTVRRDPTRPLLCAALLATALLATACTAEPAPASAPAADLVGGPLRWLMLPEELRHARRLTTSREALDFLEAFWSRRNPDPSQPVNDCARLFHERVEAADHLYAEEDRRGSLTDRGRALILLGPPPVLRYGQRRLQILEPGHTVAAPFLRSRLVAVETWVFPTADLAPPLQRLLADQAAAAPAPAPTPTAPPPGEGTNANAPGEGAAPEASSDPAEPGTVVFLVESPRHVRLLEGEHLLQLAARSLVRDLPISRRPAAPPRTPASHPEG
jgi:GWxTD domain-containing protein